MSNQATSGGPGDWLVRARSRLARVPRVVIFTARRRERVLARAEELIRDGQPEPAAALLAPMRRVVERMRSSCGPACRARWHLAWGYCRGCASSLDEAWISFQAARREADDVEDVGLARELRVRAQAELALVAVLIGNEGSLEIAGRHADEAVRGGAEVGDTYALSRLALALMRLAQAEHAAGRWKAARGHYEETMNAGMRVPPPRLIAADADTGSLRVWAESRVAAATAATEVARTLSSLGDAAGAREWFDRGRASLDGPAHPLAHLRRGILFLERAGCEPDDDVGAPTRRISWLKEAVRDGMAGGTPDGRALACRAGLDLAEQLRGLGDCAGAADLAREAERRREGLDPNLALAFEVEAKLALGLAQLDAGAEDEALAALREAMRRGGHAVPPEARLFAAAAAWHLHVALLDDRKVAEAEPVLAALEEMVPTLADPHRPAFVALMAYLRGMTRLCEGRHDEARAELQRAETLARRLKKADPDLVRSVAAGLGAVALECESWAEAEDHFRRALAAIPDDVPSARRQAGRAELLVGVARAVAPTPRTGEALASLRRAFATGVASGCSLGRKVAAHAALLEGDAPMLEPDERRRLYETAARLGRVSGLAQGRAIAAQAEARLGDLTA